MEQFVTILKKIPLNCNVECCEEAVVRDNKKNMMHNETQKKLITKLTPPYSEKLYQCDNLTIESITTTTQLCNIKFLTKREKMLKDSSE